MNNHSNPPAQKTSPSYDVFLHEGVKKFLRKLPSDEKARSSRAFLLLEELGPTLGEPHASPLGKGLWELKFHFNKKHFRYFFTHEKNGHYIIVHGFVKKTNRTPESEKEIARKRIREIGV